MDVFTIGHSDHTLEQFLDYLFRLRISVLVDCRSVPFSKHQKQFNQPVLVERLRKARIQYVDEGRSFGARPRDPALYENGRVVLERLAATVAFQAATARVEAAARTDRVMLMCSEAEPLDCPRFLLTSRQLVARGVTVQHVLGSGAVEANSVTEQRLLMLTGQHVPQLFQTPAEQMREAYRIQGMRIAFEGPPPREGLVID